MSDSMDTTIPITLMGKTFSIKCQLNQVQALEESVTFLKQRLLEMHDPNSDANFERILLITALNLVNEIMHGEEENPNALVINQKLNGLTQKIESQLTSMTDMDA